MDQNTVTLRSTGTEAVKEPIASFLQLPLKKSDTATLNHMAEA